MPSYLRANAMSSYCSMYIHNVAVSIGHQYTNITLYIAYRYLLLHSVKGQPGSAMYFLQTIFYRAATPSCSSEPQPQLGSAPEPTFRLRGSSASQIPG
jgi:hypothetical protein